MSIMERQIPSDVVYPINALVALQDVRKWFASEVDDYPLRYFHKILDDMEEERPFDPAREMVRNTGEVSPLLPTGDGFQYRRAVWSLISEEIDRLGVATLSSIRLKAGWMKQELLYCLQYVKYEIALAQFRTVVLGLELEFLEDYEGSLDDTDVVVQGRFKARGKRAKENVQKLVDGLIPALTKHIRDSSQSAISE